MLNNKILLLGASGQVGSELLKVLRPFGYVLPVVRQHTDDLVKISNASFFDLADFDRLESILDQFRPNWIVNAAAYTAVDKAEVEENIATRLNATLPSLLVDWSDKNNATMVHYSSDYVFDGKTSTPYTETSTFNPLSHYGRTKAQGDIAVQILPKHFIFRTSWVFGENGSNFVKTMIRLFQEKEEIKVVDDQIGCPTSARWLAQATILALLSNKYGTYNLTCSSSTTWYDFSCKIKELSYSLGFKYNCKINPISSSEYKTAAARPTFSILDCDKFSETFRVVPPFWQYELQYVLPQILSRSNL